MDLATDQEWSAEMAADQLSGDFLWRRRLPGLSKPTRPRPTKAEISALARRIKEAMYLGHIPWRIQHRKDNCGQPLEMQLIRPIDVIEWALTQNIPIPDEYRDWLKQVADPNRAETEDPVTQEPQHVRAGREGGQTKTDTYAERNALILEWHKELALNPSWAETIKHRLRKETKEELSTRSIQRIVKKAIDSDT